MALSLRGALGAALLTGSAVSAVAQEPARPEIVTTLPHLTALPPSPAPAPPGPVSSGVAGLLTPPGPGGPPACVPFEDCNDGLLAGDPLLDRPEAPPPGFFLGTQVGALHPHVKNHLLGNVPLGDATDQVRLPTARLGWVGVPEIDLGYRFDQGFGEAVLSYQGFMTDGAGVVRNFHFPGGAVLDSRLDLHRVGLDYANREFSLGPDWDMKWEVGARLAAVFFDSRASGRFFQQHTSNFFLGAGPHAGLRLNRNLPAVPGLGLFGNLEGTTFVGRISQDFDTQGTALRTPLLAGMVEQNGSQVVPVVHFQTGLSWSPPVRPWVRFLTGYQYEYWWQVGRLQASRADLTLQGVFFRCECRY